MKIEELRALQAPLKEHYKENPNSALIPAKAEAILDREEVACRVSTYAGTAVAGLHISAGGDGRKACSADMLMESIAACAGVTLNAVATAMRIPLEHAKVVAEGVWDVRGTLGIDRSVPVGLKEVTITFEIQSSVDKKKLDKLVELTERYCVIFQTLVSPPELKRRVIANGG